MGLFESVETTNSLLINQVSKLDNYKFLRPKTYSLPKRSAKRSQNWTCPNNISAVAVRWNNTQLSIHTRASTNTTVCNLVCCHGISSHIVDIVSVVVKLNLWLKKSKLSRMFLHNRMLVSYGLVDKIHDLEGSKWTRRSADCNNSFAQANAWCCSCVHCQGTHDDATCAGFPIL